MWPHFQEKETKSQKDGPILLGPTGSSQPRPVLRDIQSQEWSAGLLSHLGKTRVSESQSWLACHTSKAPKRVGRTTLKIGSWVDQEFRGPTGALESWGRARHRSVFSGGNTGMQSLGLFTVKTPSEWESLTRHPCYCCH